jgi:hypothetical protein
MRKLIVMALVAALAGCAAPEDGGTPSATKAEANEPNPVVLYKISGTGTDASPKFQAPDVWTLTWAYDCRKSLGGEGNFIVTLEGFEGVSPGVVDQLGPRGAGTESIHGGGTGYLTIISAGCGWSVTAEG